MLQQHLHDVFSQCYATTALWFSLHRLLNSLPLAFILAVGLLAYVTKAHTAVTLKPTAPTRYQIKRGDHLDHVAKLFLQPPQGSTDVTYSPALKKRRKLYPGDWLEVRDGGTSLVLRPGIEPKPRHSHLPPCDKTRGFGKRCDMTYEVKPGDTLWHLSRRFFLNPWLWHGIWVHNKPISNPHLIYPGQRLHLKCDAPYCHYHDLYYYPEVDVTGKFGNQRYMARLSYLQPLWQRSDRLVFANLIVMGDRLVGENKYAIEGNFGLGYRQMFNQHYILTAYSYFDLRKSRFRNVFRQLTFGLEWMTRNLEFRINGYLPQHVRKSTGIVGTRVDTAFAGNQVVVDSVTSRQFEAPLRGFDIEFGGAHPRFEKMNVFLTYYYFKGKGLSAFSGVRLRTRYRWRYWMSFDAEVNYDRVRKIAAFAGIRLTWNFADKLQPERDMLHRKMTQRPERDVDIVMDSGQAKKASRAIQEEFEDPIEKYKLVIARKRQKRPPDLLEVSEKDHRGPTTHQHAHHIEVDVEHLNCACKDSGQEVMLVDVPGVEGIFIYDRVHGQLYPIMQPRNHQIIVVNLSEITEETKSPSTPPSPTASALSVTTSSPKPQTADILIGDREEYVVFSVPVVPDDALSTPPISPAASVAVLPSPTPVPSAVATTTPKHGRAFSFVSRPMPKRSKAGHKRSFSTLRALKDRRVSIDITHVSNLSRRTVSMASLASLGLVSLPAVEENGVSTPLPSPTHSRTASTLSTVTLPPLAPEPDDSTPAPVEKIGSMYGIGSLDKSAFGTHQRRPSEGALAGLIRAAKFTGRGGIMGFWKDLDSKTAAEQQQ